MIRTVLLSLLLLALAAATMPNVKCQSAFEIRPVVDSLQPGALKLIDEVSHREVFVGRKAFFSIGDIDSVSAYSGSESDGSPLYGVNIQFRQSLNDSMRSLTGYSIGGRLAILVDGKLIAVPRILDPLRTAHVSVFMTTDAEAKELAEKISKAIKGQ